MNQHSGLTLAYAGDACYELAIRDHLLRKGLTKVNDLHKQAIRYTSAKGQAQAMERILASGISDEEESIFKRGRNANAVRKPKNVDHATYHQATGFEALIGFLYLEDRKERLGEIIALAIKTIEENPN